MKKLIILALSLSILSQLTFANCSDYIRTFKSKHSLTALDSISLILNKSDLKEKLSDCFKKNCKEKELEEIVQLHIKNQKGSFKGSIKIGSLYILTGVGISHLTLLVPQYGSFIAMTFIILYNGLAQAIFANKYASIAKWAYNIKDNEAKIIQKIKDKELDNIHHLIRKHYDFTEEEARDSKIRASSTITPALLNFNTAINEKIKKGLIPIIALNFVHLRKHYKEISPDLDFLQDIVEVYMYEFKDEKLLEQLINEIKRRDNEFEENQEYYQKLFSSLLK